MATVTVEEPDKARVHREGLHSSKLGGIVIAPVAPGIAEGG